MSPLVRRGNEKVKCRARRYIILLLLLLYTEEPIRRTRGGMKRSLVHIIVVHPYATRPRLLIVYLLMASLCYCVRVVCRRRRRCSPLKTDCTIKMRFVYYCYYYYYVAFDQPGHNGIFRNDIFTVLHKRNIVRHIILV